MISRVDALSGAPKRDMCPDSWKTNSSPYRPVLFDRSVDPDEMQDVAAANPRVLGSLRAATEQMMEANGRGTGEPVSLDADDIEELRALGYIE